MRSPVLVCVCLLWSLVEVYSQTEYPYVSFMGETLPNHAYVDLSLVGNDDNGSDSVQCHTDLSTCCTGAQGKHRGDWIPPGSRETLPFTSNSSAGIYEAHEAQRVDLYRKNNTDVPSGIYRCDIPTIAVHDDDDLSVSRESVYVGLYDSGGAITLSENMTFTVDSDLNGTSPQFTLTCTSTGGPATTVTWTRDSDTVTEGTETVLHNRVTARYTHTLTVTGRLGGLYTCTVANDKPSNGSAQLNIQAPSPPSGVNVSRNGLSSVLVSWTPPSGEPAATGYIIYYQENGGQRLSQSVTYTATTATITGLIQGRNYSFTMVTTSSILHSVETLQHTYFIEPVSISLTPLSLTVIAGDNVTLTCLFVLPGGVTGTPDFQWNRPTTPANFTTSGNMVSSDLPLSEILTSQAGEYNCTATLSGSSFMSSVTIITVQIPQPGVDVILSHTAPLYAGTGLTLTCKVTLDPHMDNGERVQTEWSGLQDIPEERYSVTGACGSGSTYTDSLTIIPLTDQDDGTYTCAVTVTGERNVKQATASDDVNITVMALPMPEIMISPETSRVIAGGTHTVQCIMTGISYLAVPPTLELRRAGGIMLATNVGFSVTHTLDPVMTSHAGQYTCRVSVVIASISVNVSDQRNSTVSIYIPQPGVDVTLNNTDPVYAGTGLTLTCTVTLDPNVDNGERVTTEWSGLQDIQEERYSVINASGSGSIYTSSLTISPLADQDDGTYICTVVVTGGSNVQWVTASDDVTITVMAPQVIISPKDSTMTVGVSHTMQCTMTDIPYLAMLPTVELIGPGDSVLATNISFTITHTLYPVMTSHAGQYTCRTSVSVDISGQSSSTLTVQILPPSVNITLNHTAPLYAGTGLTLTCTVTLDSNVNNNERVMTEWSGLQDIQEERYSVTGACGSGSIYAGSLAISPLAEGNGTYTCTVTVAGGSNVQAANASNGVTITVMAPQVPDVRMYPADSTVTDGGKHTVICVVMGTPYLPTLQLQGPRNSVLASNFNMSFTMIHTLDPVMTSHAGQYTCRASVVIASVSVDVSGQSSSTLTVHIPVPTPSINVSNTDTVYAGTTFNLTCNYTLSPSVNTTSQTVVTWMVDGVAVDTSPTRISTDGATLSFSPLATSDTGNYTCTLTVNVSQTHVTVEGPEQSEMKDITVEIPQPGVNVTLNRTAPLYAGTGLTLTCTVTLDPNVDSGEMVMTEWSGLQDIPEERYSVINAGGSGSTYTRNLTISPLSDQDDGTYICTVTVTEGDNVQLATASDDVTITVMALPAPVVSISPASGSPTAGQTYSLTCSVQVVAHLVVEPSIKWTRQDGTVVNASSGYSLILHFSPVLPSDITNYICRASVNVTGVVPVSNMTSRDLLINTPSGAPEMFEAVAGQRHVVFSWSPPPVTQHNGLITSYTLSCSPSPSSLPQSPSQSGPLTVAGFSPDTSYSCSVVANNGLGSGPPAHTTFTTLQDYSYFQLRFGGVVECSEFIASLADEKLQDITNAVIDELTTSCAECGMTNDIIERQSFSCIPKSPTYMTYRARLEGTSETDSGSLISLIEEWVSDGASIIVTGVLMTVDSECSVAISSLTEKECATDTASGISRPAAIIGGVLAVILSTTIIIATIFIKKKFTGKNSMSINRNEEHAIDSLSHAKKDDSTTADTDYEKMELQREDDHEYVINGSSVINSSVIKTSDTISSLPPTRPPLPPIPIPVVPLTGGDVGVAKKGENEVVYDNIPGDQ